MKGVTIKDALDAIHKQFKKKVSKPPSFQWFIGADTDDSRLEQQDDELELPVLAGFEWDKEESWTRLIVHQKKEGQVSSTSKKNKKKAEGE